jgi:hypothetical protein
METDLGMSLGQQNNGSRIVEMHGDLIWLLRTDYTRNFTFMLPCIVTDFLLITKQTH